MSKSDTVLKKKLDSIGDVGKLQRLRFIGSSTMDQKLWYEGGLTFVVNKIAYGSCDFAWYTDEKWVDPYNGKSVDKRPQLVVEATDGLNTSSYGDAQSQRLHHALGPFLCNVDSVYWLRSIVDSERLQEYVPGAAFFLTQYYQKEKGLTSSYLVTTDLADIKNLVTALGKFGSNSKEYSEVKRNILQKMKDMIYNPLQEKRILLPFKTRQKYIKAFWGGKIVKTIQRKESQLLKLTNAKVPDKKKIKKLNSELDTSLESLWEDYLEGEDIIKSSQNQWIKFMGARKQNWTDGQKRGGHTYVGKAIASRYLLIGSKLFDAKSDTMYILWPLMPSADISELNVRLKKDKEWIIISKAERKNMRIKTFDDLHGVSNELQQLRKPLLEPANLNKSPNKGNKIKLFTSLKDGLKDGSITLT